MQAVAKDIHEGERPKKPEESALQTPNEFHADDLAELQELAKSIAVELEAPNKTPTGR